MSYYAYLNNQPTPEKTTKENNTTGKHRYAYMNVLTLKGIKIDPHTPRSCHNPSPLLFHFYHTLI